MQLQGVARKRPLTSFAGYGVHSTTRLGCNPVDVPNLVPLGLGIGPVGSSSPHLAGAQGRPGGEGKAQGEENRWTLRAITHPEVVQAHQRMHLAQQCRVAGHKKANRAVGAEVIDYDARQDQDNWQVRADLFYECEENAIAVGDGAYEVDACAAFDGSNALCDVWWSLADPCCSHEWVGRNTWCNMPYQSGAILEILQHFLACWSRSPYTTSATFVLPEWRDQEWFPIVAGELEVIARFPAGTMLFSRPPDSPGDERVYVGPTRWPTVIARKSRLAAPSTTGACWGPGDARPARARASKPSAMGDGGDPKDGGEQALSHLPDLDEDVIVDYKEEVEARAVAEGAQPARARGAPPPVPADVPSEEAQRREVQRCLAEAMAPGDLFPEKKALPDQAEFVELAVAGMLNEVDGYVACRPSWHMPALEELLLRDPLQDTTSKAELRRSKMVLRWLRGGYRLQFRDAAKAPPEKKEKTLAMLRQQGYTNREAEGVAQGTTPPQMEFRNLKSAHTHSDFLTEKIKENLALGIVREWEHPGKPAIVSPMGVVEGSKLREILHGGYVSLWLDSPSFTYETIKDPIRYIKVGDYLFTVDAKSGYYHIPVERESQTYLGFQWQGRYYVYQALPFGIGPACWVYTQVMAAVLKPLRRRGWLLSSYIDDSIYTAATQREALGKVLVLVRLMAAIGFHLSRKKCLLWPGHQATHLGKVLDTLRLWVGVPQEKVEAFAQLAKDLLGAPSFTPRQLAKVCGKLISFMPAVTAAPLFVKTLYMRVRGAGWDDTQVAEPELVETLAWLADNIHAMNGATWALPAVATVVKVDAGEWGYGLTVEAGHQKGRELRATLPDELCAVGSVGPSSTRREVWGYCQGPMEVIRSAAGCLRGKRLLLVGDNQGAISDINKMGVKRDPAATGWIRELWQTCHKEGVSLTARWRPREMLGMADELSKEPDAGDWSLCRQVEMELYIKMGRPTLDPMADQHNNIFARDRQSDKPMLPPGRFFAKEDVPEAAAVDGLGQDWTTHPVTGARELAWVFPPLSLVGQALQLVRHQQADAIVILPIREDKWWWALLQSMPIKDSMELPGSKLFTQGKRAAKTPEHAKTYKNRWRAVKVLWN